MARKDNSRTGKGPEIAWDQAVYPTAENPDDAPVTNAGAQVPASGAAAAPNTATAPATPPAPPNAASHAKAHEAAAAGSKAAAEKAGEKPTGGQGAKQGSSKLGPRLPSLVPRDDSAS